ARRGRFSESTLPISLAHKVSFTSCSCCRVRSRWVEVLVFARSSFLLCLDPCPCEATRHEAVYRQGQSGVTQRSMAFLGLLTLAGCVSTGSVGIITKSSANPSEILSVAHPYREIGP